MQAVEWWIVVHITGDFVCVDLPITCQMDSVSCGVFAVNSIQHLIFPQEGLLLTHNIITEHYWWFLGALSQHNRLVSCFCVVLCAPIDPNSKRPPYDGWIPDPYEGLLTFKAVPLDGGFAFERTILAKTPTLTPTDSYNSPPLQPTSSLKKRLLDNQMPPACMPKRQKKLDAWFRPGTVHNVITYHQCTHLEWSKKVEDIWQQEERKQEKDQICKGTNAAERKRKQHAKEVLDDIQVGWQDSAGLIIKTKPSKVYFHCFAEIFVFTQFTATAPYLRAFISKPGIPHCLWGLVT